MVRQKNVAVYMNGDGRVGATTGKVTPTLFAVVPTDTHAPTLFASANIVVCPFLDRRTFWILELVWFFRIQFTFCRLPSATLSDLLSKNAVPVDLYRGIYSETAVLARK